MLSRRRHRVAWGLAGLAWVAAVTAGMHKLARYVGTPGRAGQPPASSSAEDRISVPRGQAILFLAVHPRCPCSRASVAQLARILARCKGRLTAKALVFTPDKSDRGEWRTGLVDQLEAIPGVIVVEDRGGIIGRRLGAFTSGHAVLYSRAGHLLFSGGITAGRGHAADNASSDIVIALATGASQRPGRAPVFGCPILIPGQAGGLPR